MVVGCVCLCLCLCYSTSYFSNEWSCYKKPTCSVAYDRRKYHGDFSKTTTFKSMAWSKHKQKSQLLIRSGLLWLFLFDVQRSTRSYYCTREVQASILLQLKLATWVSIARALSRIHTCTCYIQVLHFSAFIVEGVTMYTSPQVQNLSSGVCMSACTCTWSA